MDGEWRNCMSRRPLMLWKVRHLELCNQAEIEPLPVIVEFADAMATTGFVPRARIPSKLLIERQQVTPIPSERQAGVEATIPDVTGDKPQFSWPGHQGNIARKCTIY